MVDTSWILHQYTSLSDLCLHSRPVSSSSFCSRWHHSARKGPHALHLVSQQSPQGCLRNSTNIFRVEHKSFQTLEGGKLAFAILRSSFLYVISTGRVESWPFPFCAPLSFMWSVLWRCGLSRVRKFLKPLSTFGLSSCRPDVMSAVACQSVHPFIPSDSGMAIQGHRRARSRNSAPVISQGSQWIWVEFGILLILVCLMNLMLIFFFYHVWSISKGEIPAKVILFN